MSWLTQRDVSEGRSKMNFSEWEHPTKDSKNAAKELRDGDMPLWFYLPLHAEARLTPAERQTLIAGLEATVGVPDEEHR